MTGPSIPPIRVYLDTNVILDAAYQRRDPSARVLQRIHDEGWLASTSPLSIMEIMEAVKTDAWAKKLLDQGLTFSQVQRRFTSRRTGPNRLTREDLEALLKDIRARVEWIQRAVHTVALTPEIARRAELLCGVTTIEVTDALHLAAALESDCNLLITGDSDFASIAREFMHATMPEGFNNAVRALGV